MTRSKTTTISEATLQALIFEYLVLRGFLVLRVNSGKAGHISFVRWQAAGREKQVRGVSDILALSPDGKLYVLELKLPGEKLRPEQAQFLSEARYRNAICAVVHSSEELEKVLDGMY